VVIRRMRDHPDDYALIVDWRNRPHVREWWDPDEPPLTVAPTSSLNAPPGVETFAPGASREVSVAFRNTNGVPVVCGDLEHAPLRPGVCAAISMFHVLEHLYDPRAYLQSARELLGPKGRLIVQVPNAASWQFQLLGPRWNGVDVPRHLTDFRARDLEALLAAAGFEVLRRKYFSWRDNPAGLASSLAPALDPMARRVRGIRETPNGKLLRDLVYFSLMAAALPFTLLEAACHAGSTIMIEAGKR